MSVICFPLGKKNNHSHVFLVILKSEADCITWKCDVKKGAQQGELGVLALSLV